MRDSLERVRVRVRSAIIADSVSVMAILLTARRLLAGAGIVAVGIGATLIIRAATVPLPVSAVSDDDRLTLPAVDPGGAATRLSAAIRMRTVSSEGSDGSLDEDSLVPFIELHRVLQGSFPRVHRQLRREVVAQGSLLYTWRGSDEQAQPLVFLAHLDVVPADAAAWRYPPFAGVVDEGHVWGRGALDDKASAVALLDAAEHLLGVGFRPRATIYFAFGHDEEVGGRAGAAALAKRLAELGVEPAWVLDEGAAIVDNVVPGLAGPVATIAIAEKGRASIELSVEQDGGHSSMPPRQTAIGVLADAIRRLEEQPMRAQLAGPSEQMLDHLAMYMPFGYRLVLANQWLFRPFLTWGLAHHPQGSPLVRTTGAATMFNAGEKRNVLPREARAVVDFRILPGDTVQSVLDHVGRVVADDRVSLRLLDGSKEPPPVSPASGAAYAAIAAAIRETFGEIPVVPTLCFGGTDARHYTDLTPNVFRFVPLRFRSDSAALLHGVDERIDVDVYSGVIRFYMTLIVRATGPRRT